MDVLIQDMVMCKASNILNYNALTNRDSSFYNNEQSKGINLTQYLIVLTAHEELFKLIHFKCSRQISDGRVTFGNSHLKIHSDDITRSK